MLYIILGVAGFFLGCATEVARLQRVPGAKAALGGAAYGLLAFSLTMASVHGARFWLPPWLAVVGASLVPVASLLLLYSLILELPFLSTYVGRGPGPYLVTTGSYALVRHPTVLWYGFLLVSLLLMTRSLTLLIALPVWLALDALWAFLQERSLSLRFRSYQLYRETTPMLIPNRQSLRACLATLRSPRPAKSDSTQR